MASLKNKYGCAGVLKHCCLATYTNAHVGSYNNIYSWWLSQLVFKSLYTGLHQEKNLQKPVGAWRYLYRYMRRAHEEAWPSSSTQTIRYNLPAWDKAKIWKIPNKDTPRTMAARLLSEEPTRRTTRAGSSMTRHHQCNVHYNISSAGQRATWTRWAIYYCGARRRLSQIRFFF